MDGWMGGCMEEWKDGWMDGSMNLYGWMGGWIDGFIYKHIQTLINKFTSKLYY